MAIKKTIEIDADVSGATSEINKLDKSLGKVEGSSKKASGGLKSVGENGGAIAVLDSLTGGMATKMRDAAEATKLFNFSLKGTRTALIATGIGAAVVVLGLMVAYWEDIVGWIDGSNKSLQEHIDMQTTLVSHIDGEIALLEAKKVLAEAEGKSTTDINNAIREKIELRIVEGNQLLDDLRVQLEIEKSKANEYAWYQKIGIWRLGDKTSDEEREALAKTNAEILALETNTIKWATALANIKKGDSGEVLNAAVSGGYDPDQENEELFTFARGGMTGANDTPKEEGLDLASIPFLEGDKEQWEEGLDDFLEIWNRLQDVVNPDRKSESELLEDQMNADIVKLEQAGATEEAIYMVRMKYADKIAKAQEKEAKDEKARAQTVLNHKLLMIGRAFGAISSLMKEGSDEAKAFAAAEALINTFVGISNVWAEKSESGLVGTGLIQRIATTAVVAASGFKTVKQILATNPQNVGGAPSQGGGARPAPPSINVIGTSPESQLAQSIGAQDDKPVRAYVVSKEVSTGQELDRNIEDTASL